MMWGTLMMIGMFIAIMLMMYVIRMIWEGPSPKPDTSNGRVLHICL